MAALEGRVVLSVVAPAGHAGRDRPAHLSRVEIAQSNARDMAFGLGTHATLETGVPVAKQETTTYKNGSTQTESIVTIPDTANNTTTTYETINLRNNGGVKRVVDTESFAGGAGPFSGNNRTHILTITLPNGSTEIQTYHVVTTGDKTVITGMTDEANGAIATWTSVKIKNGRTTVTRKKTTEPDGLVEHQTTVTTRRGHLDSTSKTTTIMPDGSIHRSSSATNVIRLAPPSS
jgi:hypothetical protein